MSEPRGSLQRHLPEAAPTEQELFAMRRAAWRRQGIVVVGLPTSATRLYGRREVA